MKFTTCSDDKDLLDVTLVWSDDKLVEAHKNMFSFNNKLNMILINNGDLVKKNLRNNQILYVNPKSTFPCDKCDYQATDLKNIRAKQNLTSLYKYC